MLQRTKLLVIAAGALLCLSACATEKTPSTLPVNAEETGDIGQSAPPGASTSEGEGPEINCASIFEKKGIFENESQAGWGLKHQVAVTGGEFDLPIPGHLVSDETGHPVPTDQRPTVDPIAVDRAMECSIYGESPEVSVHYWYVKPTDFDADEFESMIQSDLEMQGSRLNGFSSMKRDGNSGRLAWAYIGDDYFIWGDSNIPDETPAAAIDGEFEPADPMEYLTEDAVTQSCSMFFANPSEHGISFGHEGKLSKITGGDTVLTTNRDFEDEYENVICDQIKWHDGPLSDAPADQQPTGKPVATNEECRIYEVEEGFLSECGDAGYGISTESQEVAELILPPKFRGFDGK
ncbi:hypothetical protein [Gulosibacter bifidus]|uniref:Lipoprotein n=1 Tax=Gulosibacter bifidus TaxID=272239 RepID=A0ABW5RIE8_9MICO|nr:hypothetical protein [Gulosibacter bifidus]